MKSKGGRDRKGSTARATKKQTIPTIHDVARYAGVSAMTISRVINGHKYVSDATRQKVFLAIEKLGFSPNAAARNIHGGARIALMYSNPSSSNLANYLMGAFRGKRHRRLSVARRARTPRGASRGLQAARRRRIRCRHPAAAAVRLRCCVRLSPAQRDPGTEFRHRGASAGSLGSHHQRFRRCAHDDPAPAAVGSPRYRVRPGRSGSLPGRPA